MENKKANQQLINIVGKNIKILREKKGLTRNDLVESLGITTQAISQYENCKRLPNDKILSKIADILNVSLSDFFVPPSTKDETMKLKSESTNFINKLVSADIFGEDKEGFINEQLVLADLYDKYFMKLFQWRLQNINSAKECFEIIIPWIIGLQYERLGNINEADIQELSTLFGRLLEMKSHEHEFFTFYQEKYGATDYSVLSRTFLTSKDNKEGE